MHFSLSIAFALTCMVLSIPTQSAIVRGFRKIAVRKIYDKAPKAGARQLSAREISALLILGCATAAVPSIATAASYLWGESTDMPVLGDFDGDGKTDIAVWRPSTGYWYIIQSSNGAHVAKQWGAPTDVPVVGDFDGDGKADIAVWRPSTGYWYILQSSNGAVVTKQWGAPTDKPVVGDFDGDGKSDIAVWRPSTGDWYIIQSSNGAIVTKQWGAPTDKPVVGDFDGDDKSDIAVWRPSTGYWYIIQSSNGAVVTKQWGAATDEPVVGDFDGDGKGDIAVWRPSTGYWYIVESATGQEVSQQWGETGDTPVQGHYGGTQTEEAVWRASDGTWYISSPGASWTWMSGSNLIGASGVYGTKGVASASKTPGARSFQSSWTDSSGNFWLFGGECYDSTGRQGYCNDLWKYNLKSAAWTWLGGSNVVNGTAVYGTQGVASTSNMPGARNSATSWTDSSGNLWLFGGLGCLPDGLTCGLFNDLWKYSPSSGKWTWVGGSNSVVDSGAVYGTRGVASTANNPGTRIYGHTWTDAAGNLWMFGGGVYDPSTGGNGAPINDLWKYTPSTAEWTWVGGSNVLDASGVYGMQGVPSASNIPGARTGASFWTDLSGNFWLFGGYCYDSIGQEGGCNDLWKYSPIIGEWTWVGGSSVLSGSTLESAGVWGTQGVASASNVPGGRGYAISWVDPSGNLWLFGGSGVDSAGEPGLLNDLWNYNPRTGEWTWVSGLNVVTGVIQGQNVYNDGGVYGTKGVPSASNRPGGREAASAWADSSGNLWLFGGDGLDSTNTIDGLNDLWRFTPAQ